MAGEATNKELVILDGCRQLKSLDLRMCSFIDLKGDLGKRCSQQIKCVKLPDDSLEGCQYIYGYDSNLVDDSDDEFDEYYDYDDYTKYDELKEMLAFKPMFG
ncbi:hypothetical protein L6452_34061 [Arctium lappa]|uniref:Uncharacterized protein n=2 Tax=Arctium lappa TaxID=4217 RepID=A0ACB8YIS0_ARCLA|nr:hypothetical protein L6452_34059 [Arctium lappa]KAI3684834.1 hypothetical protein L6452_34061 [Arctium lappa]